MALAAGRSESPAAAEQRPSGGGCSETAPKDAGPSTPKIDCIYLQEADLCARRDKGGPPCTAPCDFCLPNDKFTPEVWLDPLYICDRRSQPTECLRGVLAGASVFLICGGPSANEFPHEWLHRKGVWSMAVNNSAAHPGYRPQAFVCSDPPMKFHQSIWMDPAMMKFIPTAKLLRKRNNLRKKVDGKFLDLGIKTPDCPNVWGFERESFMWPDDRFFTGRGACWGNHNAGTIKTGEPKTVCTMLLAIRLLRYLGARRVFMVGVDFRMTPQAGYSFAQERRPEDCQSNNVQFSIVNEWLCTLQQRGTFKKFGMEIFNCYERSGLRAFPYVPINAAIKECQGECDNAPDLSGWYQKK